MTPIPWKTKKPAAAPGLLGSELGRRIWSFWGRLVSAFDRGPMVLYSKCLSNENWYTRFYHTVIQKASDKPLIFAVGCLQHLLYERMMIFVCWENDMVSFQ
jgi:hypothetical protein